MPVQNISAPLGRSAHVVVYEPRQRPTDDEVILDQFDLGPGEVRPYNFTSFTASFRLDDPAMAHSDADDLDQGHADSDTPLAATPETEEEMAAGAARVAALADRDSVVTLRAETERKEDTSHWGEPARAAVQDEVFRSSFSPEPRASLTDYEEEELEDGINPGAVFPTYDPEEAPTKRLVPALAGAKSKGKVRAGTKASGKDAPRGGAQGVKPKADKG